MSELNIRLCDGSDRDYGLVANVISSVSDEPMSISRLKEIDSWRPEGGYHQRGLIYSGTECIGSVLHFYQPGDMGSSEQCILFDLVPSWQGKGFESLVIDQLIEQARSHGAAEVRTGSRDNHFDKLAAILDYGFVKRCSYTTSELDLERFDPGVCGTKTESIVNQGIDLLSSAQLAERGIDWLDLQYGFLAAPEMPPIDEFKKKSLESPGHFPESQFAAFKGMQVLGVTSLRLATDQPGCAGNDLTKVVVEMKRKGIATALKAASLSAAKSTGIKKVRTCNESTNPMLILNRQLGYVTVYEDIEFVKKLDV